MKRSTGGDLIWPDRFKLCNLKLVRPKEKEGLFALDGMISKELVSGKFNRLVDEEGVNELAKTVEEKILAEPTESMDISHD